MRQARIRAKLQEIVSQGRNRTSLKEQEKKKKKKEQENLQYRDIGEQSKGREWLQQMNKVSNEQCEQTDDCSQSSNRKAGSGETCFER